MNIIATTAGSARHNRLLGALPEAEWERLSPHLRAVWLPLGQALYEPGGKLDFVYFPTTAVVSFLGEMIDGDTAYAALKGNEGIVGAALLLGGDTNPNRSVVESAGWAYRIRSGFVQAEFARNGAFLRLVLRYVQALITQIAQTAVCNRLHSIDQQLCRWLLLSLDRVEGNELAMTQDLIGNMLGVRREGVTEAAGNLQRAGLIQYRRGRIIVLNRAGLEARCCECYEVVRKEYDRLIGAPQTMSEKMSIASIASTGHTNRPRRSEPRDHRAVLQHLHSRQAARADADSHR